MKVHSNMDIHWKKKITRKDFNFEETSYESSKNNDCVIPSTSGVNYYEPEGIPIQNTSTTPTQQSNVISSSFSQRQNIFSKSSFRYTPPMNIGNLAISSAGSSFPYPPSGSGIHDNVVSRPLHSLAHCKIKDSRPLDYCIINKSDDRTDPNDIKLEESKKKKRTQRCQRCSNHGVTSAVKGHKYSCPRRNCPCPKCQATTRKQESMKHQKILNRSAEPINEPMDDDSQNEHIEQEFYGNNDLDRDLDNICDDDLYAKVEEMIKNT